MVKRCGKGTKYMRSDEARADAPQRWLANARADLALAQVPLPEGGLYEHLCFHAHQAAEKSIKSVLLHLGIAFPFTHNLQSLLALLPGHLPIPGAVAESVVLTPYAVATRYPGEMEPVTEEDYREAVLLAQTVYGWAKTVMSAPDR